MERSRARSRTASKHLRHLCNNIPHAVKVGGSRLEAVAWFWDFDSLTDRNNCTSAEEYPKLGERLYRGASQMMKEDKSHDYDDSKHWKPRFDIIVVQ